MKRRKNDFFTIKVLESRKKAVDFVINTLKILSDASSWDDI